MLSMKANRVGKKQEALRQIFMICDDLLNIYCSLEEEVIKLQQKTKKYRRIPANLQNSITAVREEFFHIQGSTKHFSWRDDLDLLKDQVLDQSSPLQVRIKTIKEYILPIIEKIKKVLPHQNNLPRAELNKFIIHLYIEVQIFQNFISKLKERFYNSNKKKFTKKIKYGSRTKSCTTISINCYLKDEFSEKDCLSNIRLLINKNFGEIKSILNKIAPYWTIINFEKDNNMFAPEFLWAQFIDKEISKVIQEQTKMFNKKVERFNKDASIVKFKEVDSKLCEEFKVYLKLLKDVSALLFCTDKNDKRVKKRNEETILYLQFNKYNKYAYTLKNIIPQMRKNRKALQAPVHQCVKNMQEMCKNYEVIFEKELFIVNNISQALIMENIMHALHMLNNFKVHSIQLKRKSEELEKIYDTCKSFIQLAKQNRTECKKGNLQLKKLCKLIIFNKFKEPICKKEENIDQTPKNLKKSKQHKAQGNSATGKEMLKLSNRKVIAATKGNGEIAVKRGGKVVKKEQISNDNAHVSNDNTRASSMNDSTRPVIQRKKENRQTKKSKDIASASPGENRKKETLHVVTQNKEESQKTKKFKDIARRIVNTSLGRNRKTYTFKRIRKIIEKIGGKCVLRTGSHYTYIVAGVAGVDGLRRQIWPKHHSGKSEKKMSYISMKNARTLITRALEALEALEITTTSPTIEGRLARKAKSKLTSRKI